MRELVRRISELERRLDNLIQPEVAPQPVFLQASLTSTSWDGDAKADASDGTIDLSADFGVPAGVKAVMVRLAAEDETVGVAAYLGPSAGERAVQIVTQVADEFIVNSGVVPCDSSGDIYWFTNGELDQVFIEIFGYWI